MNSLRIVLDRTSSCPSYSVEVRGDGSVTFNGQSFTLISGIHHEQITESAVSDLVNQFRQADFFSLKDEYKLNVTDGPTFKTFLEFDGHKKQVIDYFGFQSGMPEVVTALEESIDRATETEKWIKETDRTWPALQAEKWDFKAATKENSDLFANVLAEGSNDLVQKFVAAGVLTSDFGKNGEGPLVNASGRGDADIVSRLLMRHEPLSASLLFRALRAAAGSGSLETVDLLLEKGADVNGKSSDGDIDDETVLMAAARSGNADVVNEILRHHPDLKAVDHNGDNVIARRLRLGQNLSDPKAVIEALVSAGVDVNARNDRRETFIFGACYDYRGVKPLAVAGADLNVKNGDGNTMLMTCYDPAFAKAMIEAGADLFMKDNDGMTAAQLMRESDHDDVADILEAAMKAKQKSQ